MPAPVRRPAQRTGLLASMGRHWNDYLYILPALAVMIVVIAYPIYYTIYLSFFDTPPSSPNWYFNGLGNYGDILSDSTYTFWDSTRNTVVWTVGSTFFAFILGFAAALLVHREFVMRGLVRGLLLVPWVISAVPAAYIWRWMYHSDYGLISGTLMQLGIVKSPVIFLDSVNLADGAERPAARGARRWCRGMAVVHQRDGAAPEGRDCDHHDPALRRESQLVHPAVHHDRRWPCEFLDDLDCQDLSARVPGPPLRAGICLRSDPLLVDDGPRLLLCEGADRW
jgi:hypothetical protein